MILSAIILRFIVETPRITGSFSLASLLGNALALSLQSRGLKLKICSSELGRFFCLIPGCARSLHRGDKGSEVELFWGGFEIIFYFVIKQKEPNN